MKRFFLLTIPLILIISVFLSGCSLGEVSREQELEDSFDATCDELDSTFSGDTGKYSLVSEYLNSWAKKNDIAVTKKDEHYMVLTNPATQGWEDKESTVIQCPVETDNFNSSLKTLAIALTSLLGPLEHGEIKVIVTENNSGELIGATDADPEYYQCDNVINLKQNPDTEIVTEGSSSLTSTMTSDITTTAPSYSTAFAITMTMASYADPFEFGNHYPNPIEVIGSLLATQKSSGKLFQLASFNCEAADGYVPISATAVVVVDSNNIESFTKKFDSSYENVKERFDKLEDNFVYTLTETTMPSSVMTIQASDNIISLMYTLQTGIYLQDEDTGEIISASDTSFVSTENGKFQMILESRSSDARVLTEMSDAFLTTSGLCDIQYNASEIEKTWTANKEKPLAKFFVKSLGSDEDEPLTTMQSTECDILSGRIDDLNMILYRCSTDHGKSALKNITRFLESLGQ